MIVRNESKIIERCLNSVKDIVDYIYITDTGSNDNTQGVILDWLSKNKHITGKVRSTTFVDFEVNRTDAIKSTRRYMESVNYEKKYYILVMDADEVFINYGFNSAELTNDYYSVFYEGEFLYSYPVLFRSTVTVDYKGKTHEYPRVVPRPGLKRDAISHDFIKSFKISHIADGGHKKEKFERDIKILSEVRDVDPDYPRALFYLANSYYDSGDWRMARDTYLKRISLHKTTGKGYAQEAYYSYYRLVNLHLSFGDLASALNAAFESLSVDSERFEAIYLVGMQYYYANNYEAGFRLLSMVANAPLPSDLFFVDSGIYKYMAPLYAGLCAYHTGRKTIFRTMNQIVIDLCHEINTPRYLDHLRAAEANTAYY